MLLDIKNVYNGLQNFPFKECQTRHLDPLTQHSTMMRQAEYGRELDEQDLAMILSQKNGAEF